MTSGRLAGLAAIVFLFGPVNACTSNDGGLGFDPAVDLGLESTSAALTAASAVRVNQVGYLSASSKRAYLMSASDATGAAFTVRNASNVVVFSATVGAKLGAWSRSYGFVHPIDFGTVTTAGTYTIAVAGVASPAFKIDTGANVYGQALSNALSFYQTERDGPNYIANANGLRTAPGHLNDATARAYVTPTVNSSGRFSGDLVPVTPETHVDATGAWWDAGDYIKGVETLSYAVAMLIHGVREFPAQMGAGSATANFTAEARFGADFLLRMWDDRPASAGGQVLYYQVGIGSGNAKTTGDHDLFRLPQADDNYGGTDPLYRYIRNRPVFRSGPPDSLISPNLAGRSAAALAIAFQVFKTADASFANRCLLAAQHLLAHANTAPSGNLTTYVPFSFYPETEWLSDLELGAVELYHAVASGPASTGWPTGLVTTDPAAYLGQAAHWANQYMLSAADAADTLNLYDVSGLAHYDLHRAITGAGNPAGLETSRAALLADMKKALDKALAQASADAFQFGFPWDVWDTTAHGTGLAIMTSEYDELSGTSTYADWTSRWLANVLGANAWGVSLIVGDGTTFPRCIHHQVANLAGALDGTTPILKGAVVEGPNGTLYTGFQTGMRNCPGDDSDAYAVFNSSRAKFKDDIESFSTVEPAVDLSALSPLAFARQVLGRL
jgi:endoglucanase